jgi:ribonuclease I
MFLTRLIFLILLSILYSQRTCISRGFKNWDYNLLAITWSKTLCKANINRCIKSKSPLSNKLLIKGFTIHGLWQNLFVPREGIINC